MAESIAPAAAQPATRQRPERLRASADLAYPFEPPTPDGAVVEVAPGILWARVPMPMALDYQRLSAA